MFAGFLSGAALIIAIGAQNSFVLRQGLRREHVLLVVLVCACADGLLIAAGVAGLGALIRSMPVMLEVARFGGVAFLAAYGLSAAKRALQKHELVVVAETEVSIGAALAMSLGFTFLNPHVYLDTVLLLGSLANQRAGTGKWFFAAGAMTASFSWFFGLGYGAQLLTPVFRRAIAWRVLDSLIALTMMGLCVALLLD
jgi:L-lysine exporter family protein LysE/ArgO